MKFFLIFLSFSIHAQSSNFSEIQTLLKAHCIDCHDSNSYSPFTSFTSIDDFINKKSTLGNPLVDPGKPENSELYLRLKFSDSSKTTNMPKGDVTWDASSTQKIKDWILSLQNYKPQSIANISGPSLRLGSKFFVEQKLLNIFGPSISKTIEFNIHDKSKGSIQVFGGSCSLYDANIPCSSESDTRNFVSRSNTQRSAYLLKTAVEISNNCQAILFAIKQIQGVAPKTCEEISTKPNEQELTKAFLLFYDDTQAPKVIVTKLSELNSQSETPYKSWQILFEVLIRSAGWQIF